MLFTELETERLYLKNISTNDREFVFKQFSDKDVVAYLYDAEPYTSYQEADEIIEFYLQPEPRSQHRWIMIYKANGEKIGTCGFHYWNQEQGSVEIGYDLQKKYWGKGLMQEAVRAILDFADDKMKVKRIDAHIYPDNIRSVRLIQSLGFQFNEETVYYKFRNVDYLHHVYSRYSLNV